MAIKPIAIPGLTGGLDTSAPRDAIRLDRSPDMQNFIVAEDGTLRHHLWPATRRGREGAANTYRAAPTSAKTSKIIISML